MDKQKELIKLEKKVQKLKKHFPLAKKAVMGEGNLDSKIVFFGEAPGKVENETGRPFVGRAGKFLDKMLSSGRIRRKEIFIASGIVKFYPGRRAPTPKEIELCLPYTLKQIAIIKPKLTVLLGNVAIKSLLDRRLEVSKIHGKLFRTARGVFFPTFHPSAAMRFPVVRKKMENDFRKLKKVIHEIE